MAGEARFAVTNAVMAESDRRCIESGTPSIELMNRAAAAIAEACPRGGRIYVFCGSGNNGGDGYAAARILLSEGETVKVFAVSDKVSADAGYYRDLLVREYPQALCGISECDYEFDVAVDCLFGTGFRGEPRGIYGDVIDGINAARGFVLSADIASGLDGTNGIAVKAVKADLTVAIQTFKTGHFLNDGKDCSGRVIAADIGIPVCGKKYRIIGDKDVAKLFPPRKNNSNKGSYGKCAVVGGCSRYVGAVKLADAGAAALRAGAGLNVLCVPDCISGAVGAAVTESTLAPLGSKDGALLFDKYALDEAVRGCRAVAVGMGMGPCAEENRKFIAELFSLGIKVIVDADGLNALAGDTALTDNASSDVLLTPHPGEFARLTGRTIKEVLADPIALAEEFAAAHRCTVLLKGASTFVTDGERGALVVNGTPALAKGGSGDTLSGVITGLAAQGADLFDAACAGAYLCAEAAKLAAERFGEQGVLASDVATAVKTVAERVSATREDG